MGENVYRVLYSNILSFNVGLKMRVPGGPSKDITYMWPDFGGSFIVTLSHVIATSQNNPNVYCDAARNRITELQYKKGFKGKGTATVVFSVVSEIYDAIVYKVTGIDAQTWGTIEAALKAPIDKGASERLAGNYNHGRFAVNVDVRKLLAERHKLAPLI
jgi:hypothetical protein